MKRSWIGLILLLGLLILGLLVTWSMGRIHEPVAHTLEQAAQYTLLGDWANAEQCAESARNRWEAWAHFRTCFADHAPVEEIDAGFAALRVYGSAREDVAFAAACMELSRKVSAVGEAHGLYWWNML